MALLCACSSADAVSTPVISDLLLNPSSVSGETETGTFVVSNAAGVGALSLHLTLTAPNGTGGPPEVAPLSVSGAAAATSANGQLSVVIPASAPVGTYSVTVSVSDGTETSNTLNATFRVE